MPYGENPFTCGPELPPDVALEQHRRKLNRIDPGYGVFMSFCVPRLLATIRQLQRDLGEVRNERDDARALLHNLTG